MTSASSTRPSLTVLITRPRDHAQEFATLLREGGAEPLFFPTIEIAPPESWEACDARLQQIDAYTDLIFTSPNAVRFFLERCARFFDLARLRTRTFHAVGPKTAHALAAHGFSVAALPEDFDAAHLAEAIASVRTTHARRFLFPKGDLAEETLVRRLQAAGLSVDSVTVYRTVKPNPPAETQRAIWRALQRGEIHVVTFFSPSSVRNFVDFFPNFPALFSNAASDRPPKIAVLGETTARACRTLGLPVHLCPEGRSAAALARAILQQRHQGESA
ncbi:MAG: uroporphyrinogen-III synthase [Blastocatellia bacterium]|nr:uroporphyrinogen-III synthase [Blastocatellia bacterium]MCS7156180.1 uroporphyrinogen-III synthase [Blastocatellia bacterium]MCX7751470.1 uroporphyrinogen-III synthase [Blastocatellia bacterium]MDW8169183.1 uroporphyrinogen-III synthase [Acidobacteriota bacterium]MDW8256044.1 uroporphyrinogen-III synthase [Acidobacteriota bacterium]